MRRQGICQVDGDWIEVEMDGSDRLPVDQIRAAANLPADRALSLSTRDGRTLVLNPGDYVQPNDELITTPTGIRG
jgi:hypothetical protein